MQRAVPFTLAAFAAIALSAAPAWSAEPSKNIVETAMANDSFQTLVTAIKAADLVDALQQKGPFTVFAPTNEAFDQLPAGTVESLLKPENKDQLAAVLTYHVVPGRVTAKQVVDLTGAKTLNGQQIDISVEGSTVKVDNASVVKTDIACTNGVIHVIDRVILPSSSNLVETAQEAGSFSTLLTAAKAAGLAQTLADDGPFTVFAPTDEAFGKLPKGTVESLLEPANKGQLGEILKYHVVSGRVYSTDAIAAKSAETLQGSAVNISASNDQVHINKAKVVTADLDASNGVIHVIDSVLMPPEEQKVSMRDARETIVSTINRGTQLFNAGDAEACARLYENTIEDLVTDNTPLSQRTVDVLENAMRAAEGMTSPTRKSWIMRYALDEAYATVQATR